MRSGSLNIAVVGLRFGSDFVPIYQSHPDVASVILCDADPEKLDSVGDRFGISARLPSLDAVLASENIDAVHLVTPLYLHVDQAVRVLEAGKHCACAVTMGTTLEDLRKVIGAQRASALNYMMMETVVYSREYLYVKDLYDRGEIGDLTFLRGIYFQDVEGYADYWRGVPPMHYATHAVAPLLALTGTRATAVHCLGSGLLTARLKQSDFAPFRLETGIFQLEGMPVAAEVTRSWFETARPYVEGFNIYGTRMGFEWNQLWGEHPAVFTLSTESSPQYGRRVGVERVKMPDFADRLPEAIRKFTDYEHDGAHGGSHPHLAHEFVRSVVEARKPAIDAVTAANWTAPGICAHQSALCAGEVVEIPAF